MLLVRLLLFSCCIRERDAAARRVVAIFRLENACRLPTIYFIFIDAILPVLCTNRSIGNIQECNNSQCSSKAYRSYSIFRDMFRLASLLSTAASWCDT